MFPPRALANTTPLENLFFSHDIVHPQKSNIGGKDMPLIRKRRIWWELVPEVTNYIVYVSRDKTVFDSQNFKWGATPGIIQKGVSGKTELVIPDEWPEFPKESGICYVGVTARDEVGNESDPFLSEGLFKFIPPSSPSRGGVESL